MVKKNEAGSRLDVFLHDGLLSRFSREHIIRLIKSEKILVDGKKVKAGFKISEGNNITVEKEEPKTAGAHPQNIPLDIVYEDSDMIVVNKPRGLVVHPGSGNHDNTLVNAVMYHTNCSLSSVGGIIRPGIVHRIDKDTSGLLVVAKSDTAHEFLAKQFKAHSVTREYTALCEGQIEHNRIMIDKPIARSRTKRKNMDIVSDGKRAVSHISVVERYSRATLISAELETGRTHQIRVHLKSIGHPIIGDPKYGRKSELIEGQALHAARLGFIKPSDKKYIEFSVDPPKDFENLIAFLKSV